MPTIVTGGTNPQNEGNQISNNQSQQNPEIAQNSSLGSQPSAETNQYTSASQIATPQIVNNTVPIVVFVGPPSSGKSMILVRLAKYLRKQGYTVKTDPTFLNTAQYQKDCEEFTDKLNTNVALSGSVAFLLINVYKDGREVAKLLEAPGEDFYTTDPGKIQSGKNTRVEPYLSAIMTSENPKSYVLLLDLDSEISFRKDSYHRDSYSQRFLDDFYPNIDSKRDRIVLLYNKIDVTSFGTIHGCTDPKGAKEDAKLYYPQLFSTMKVHILGGLLTSDNYVFKTFCTGKFSKMTKDNGVEYQTYNVAQDSYPQELWKEITRRW